MPFAIFLASLLASLFSGDEPQGPLLAIATMSTEDAHADAPPCRVLLLGRNSRRPLRNREAQVAVFVDGSHVDGSNVESDEKGVIDIGPFRARHAELLKTHAARVGWEVGLDERASAVDLTACGAKPIPVAFDVGMFTVKGRFVTKDGRPVRVPRDLFPEAVREHVRAQHGWWAAQLRVYADDERLLVNEVRANREGIFTLDLDAPGRLRFELLGEPDYRLATTAVDVAKDTTAIDVVLETKPFCVYGTVHDATDGTPLADGVSVAGGGEHFNEGNEPSYVLFFDEPGKRALTARDSDFQRRYVPQTIEVDVREPVQRQDFRLEPIARAESAIRLRIEIGGDPIHTGVSLSVRGDDFSTNEYGDADGFEVVVPRPGRYTVGAFANDYVIGSAEADVERSQTVRLTAVEKRTRLIVRVLGPDGAPVSFPRVFQLHEAPTNCVWLEDDSVRAHEPYASSFVAGLGGAIRPDENGIAQFALMKGGKYRVTVALERFEKVVREVQLVTGEVTRIDVVLKNRIQ